MNCIGKYILAVFFYLGIHSYSNGQNYIGMHRDQIILTMKKTQKNSKLNTNAVNTHYKYLKYEDKISEITTLFFLSEDNKCTLIRKMCDYSNINDILAELNATYRSTGKNTWEYTDKGKIYSIILTEEDWFFTVTTRLKE